MDFLTRMRIERMAAHDARNEYEANIDILGNAILGPRPKPPGEIEDANLLAEEGTDVRLEALRDEIEALERQRFELRPRALYAIGVLAMFLIESAAAFYVLGDALGYEGRERLILGVSLAAATVLVASGVSWAERASRTTIGKWALRLVASVVFCAVVVSLAWLRATSGDDDLSVIDLATVGLVLTVATAAPGIIIHLCATGFARTHSLVARETRARKELRDLERRRDRARDRQVDVERKCAEWDADLAQLRAVYLSRHRQVTAELTAKRAGADATQRAQDARSK